MLRLALFILAVCFLAGCKQQVYNIEYYEPTSNNKDYCTTSNGKVPGKGPIKRIQSRTGTPDMPNPDEMSLKLSVF